MRTRFINLRIPDGGNDTMAAEIVVEGGRIAEVLAAEMETAAGDEQWVNLNGALVLPGVIDSHVHFNDPGFTHREDFSSGTTAAAAGGVTCVADMPCTSLPPVTTAANLQHKVKAISGKAHVDFMLWGGVSGDAMDEEGWQPRLEELIDEGVAAIKVYTLSGMDTFPELSYPRIRDVARLTRRLGIPIGVHAEDCDLVRELTERIRGRGGDTAIDYAASRPAAAEVAAVGAIIETCRATGARLHIVHLGAGEALDMISAARLEGLPISAETCPHFLEFTDSDLVRLGSLLKTAPVVKSATDRERLWQGLAAGELDFVATDHAAGQWPEEKHSGSIWTDYGGVPGVELVLSHLYSEGVCRGRITLERLTQVTASVPARFLGIDHRKGRLTRGLDADFVVFDDHLTWKVNAKALHNLNRYTPLDGRALQGRVRATYVRGQCVFRRKDDGSEMFSPPGTGKWIRRGVT